MITGFAVERYQFGCSWCGARWIKDYDVQYLEDASGDTWAFYWLDGRPTLAPTAGEELCPRCHRPARWVTLIARRDVPLASLESDQSRVRVTTTPAQRRAVAPHLDAAHNDPSPRPDSPTQPDPAQANPPEDAHSEG